MKFGAVTRTACVLRSAAMSIFAALASVSLIFLNRQATYSNVSEISMLMTTTTVTIACPVNTGFIAILTRSAIPARDAEGDHFVVSRKRIA